MANDSRSRKLSLKLSRFEIFFLSEERIFFKYTIEKYILAKIKIYRSKLSIFYQLVYFVVERTSNWKNAFQFGIKRAALYLEP